jgi:sulfate permease, SulP family
MKVGKMRQLWRLRRADFWLALIALVGVLIMPTLPALGIAVVVSLLMLVWRSSQPRLTFLGRARGGLEPVDLQTAPDAAIPGLLVVRPDEMLFFANVAAVRDRIVEAAADAEPHPDVVLLDLGLTPGIDVPVVDALEDLHQRLGTDGTELWLCNLRPEARELLDRAGVLGAVGPDRVHPRVLDGIVAFALRRPGSADRVTALGDLLAFIRKRATQPGLSAEAVELLTALEERLSLELSEATGAPAQSAAAPTTSDGGGPAPADRHDGG